MSSDPDREPPDSSPDDDVYVTDEEGEPTMVGPFGGPESDDRTGGFDGLVDPKVYVLVLAIGAVLFILPEPVTTTLGIGFLLVGAFLAIVDVLSP